MNKLKNWLNKINPWHGIWYDAEHDMWFEGDMETEMQKAKDAGLL